MLNGLVFEIFESVSSALWLRLIWFVSAVMLKK
jgi:hypothetical protein